jgi:hypothetical protein
MAVRLVSPPLKSTQAENRAPFGALTWETPAQRNKLLKAWQRGVFAIFGEQQVRVIKLCWVLANLFNVKTGYCYATNAKLAEMTLIAENKVQTTLKELEDGRAIVRGWITHPNGQKQRVIYPGRAIAAVVGGPPTVGVGGDPHLLGVHTLRRVPRMPKTQIEHAWRIAEARQSGQSARDLLDQSTQPSHVANPEAVPLAAEASVPPPTASRVAKSRKPCHDSVSPSFVRLVHPDTDVVMWEGVAAFMGGEEYLEAARRIE